MFHGYILREDSNFFQRWFFLPCFFFCLFVCWDTFFLNVRVGCFWRSTRNRSSFSNTFLHCPQWSWMDPCQANLGQLLALDQVPEITGPAHFLWAKVSSPWSQNTDLESVTRLSWPSHYPENIFFVVVLVGDCTSTGF